MLTLVYYGQPRIIALNLCRDEIEADALDANEVDSIWREPHCTVENACTNKIFIVDFALKFVYIPYRALPIKYVSYIDKANNGLLFFVSHLRSNILSIESICN